MKRGFIKFLPILTCLAFLVTLCAVGVSASDLNKAVTVEYYGRYALSQMDNKDALLYAYDQLVSGIENAQTSISVYDGTHPLSENELHMVMEVYRHDHAEHFWLDNSYQYSSSGGSVLTVLPQYLLTGDAMEDARNEFEDAVEDMLKNVNDSMTDFEKELALHDALAEKITYIEGTHAHNAYGALVEGKAVCEGYAEALQYLLQRCQIQSFLVTGRSYNAATGEYEGHEWNIVRIDDKYYHVDLTWNDQDITYHAYFNQTDAVIQEDHILDTTAYPLPVCNSADANYHVVKGGKLDSFSVDAVAEHLKNNNWNAAFYIPGDVNGFLTWFNNHFGEVAAAGGLSGNLSCTSGVLGHEVLLSIEKTDSFVAQGNCGDNLIWTLDNEGTLTISGTGDMWNSSMNSQMWDSYKSSILCVVFEGEVTSIGAGAFQYCEKLTEITIPDSVKSIGGSAFKYCESLTCVIIGDGVTTIGDTAFGYCDSLSSVTFGNSVTKIDSYAFYYCYSLKNVIIGESVTTIGDHAFSSSGLASVTIPNGVTTIGGSAFYSCDSLISVTIPDSVTSLGSYAFSDCARLTTVVIGDGVTSIGYAAFSWCEEITHVTIGDGVTSIGGAAFKYCERLKVILIPEGVTSIGEDAFYYCERLWHVLYKGTEAQRGEIKIGGYNSSLTSATWHYNCTGYEIVNNVCTICCNHKWELISVHKEPTCIETGEGTYSCSLCTSTKTDVVATVDHDWKDATCTEPKTCKTCGATEGSAKGHDWKDATCTEPKTCKICGATEGSAKGHDWKDATCTEPKTCKTCGATEGSAMGHDWKDATCTEPKTCKTCGATEGSAKGHEWSAATCTAPKTCKTCGATEGSAKGHDWSAATCTEPKTCKICGATEGSAMGHEWSAATCTEPKTCKTCGATEGSAMGHEWSAATCTEPKTCKTCGATEGSAKGHEWSAATCTEPKTCKICGATEGSAMGHDWKDATCTAPKTCTRCAATDGDPLPHDYGQWIDAGNQHQKTCTGCGAAVMEDHIWDDGVVVTEPGEYTDGQIRYACTVCAAQKLQIIPSLGHEHRYAAVVTEPTCTEAGFTTYTCGCGDSYTETGAAALGHCYDSVVVEPSCQATGYTSHTCAICGHSYTDAPTAKLEHVPEVIAGYAPTCTENGMTDGSVCTACGETIVAQTSITMLGHQFDQWEIVKEATAEEPGEKVHSCTVCGEEEREIIPATGPAPTEPTEPPTEPTEPPTVPTEPTVPATDATEPTVPITQPTMKPTQPNQTVPQTTGGAPAEPQEDNSTMLIVVIIAICLVIGAAALLLVKKKK